jgi:hypothetical protein
MEGCRPTEAVKRDRKTGQSSSCSLTASLLSTQQLAAACHAAPAEGGEMFSTLTFNRSLARPPRPSLHLPATQSAIAIRQILRSASRRWFSPPRSRNLPAANHFSDAFAGDCGHGFFRMPRRRSSNRFHRSPVNQKTSDAGREDFQPAFSISVARRDEHARQGTTEILARQTLQRIGCHKNRSPFCKQ